MIGYNEVPSRKKKRFDFPQGETKGTTDWVIEVAANTLPCRQEPLVLAALLKLLLRRSVISPRLEFNMSEVVKELRWKDNPLTHKEIDRIISKYVALTYDKRQKRRGEEVDEDAGIYSFLISYIRSSEAEARGLLPTRKYNYADFNQMFVEGLKRGQVHFAGINFGPLKLERENS
ncbi:MAG: hypothetical protein WBP93_14905 [Pyrinomonadaceae bacterium]